MNQEVDPRWPFVDGVFGELLLRVNGQEPSLASRMLRGTTTVLMAGSCLALMVADRLAIPGTLWDRRAVIASSLAMLLAGTVLSARWLERARRGRGPVLFTALGVCPGESAVLVPWAEVRGYSADTDDGLIELAIGQQGLLVVPVGSDGERERVAHLLEERAIPRLD